MLSKAKCEKIIEQIQGVADKFDDYMHLAGVSDKTISMLISVLEKNNSTH